MKYFIAVAEAGSVAGAAQAVGISQPSLSTQIKQIESQLEVALLVRSAKGVTLTEAGQVLLRHASAIIKAADTAMNEVRLAGTELVGQVVFGFPSSVSMVLSVPLAETVRHEMPGIRLRAVEAMSGFVRDWLMEGAIDLAILYDLDGLADCEVTPLLSEELKFYCAEDAWPFAAPLGAPVALVQAASQELVLPSANHGLRMLIDDRCSAMSISPNVVVEMDSLTQILALVSRGSAATILAPAAGDGHLGTAGLVAAPIVNPSIRRHVYLVRRADRRLTRATRAVEQVTVKIVQELVTRGLWTGELIA